MFSSTVTQTDSAAPETLLIVDDDEMIRAILENIFAGQYRIEQAENGRQGLESILADPGRLDSVVERQKDALLAQASRIIELGHGMIASLAAAIEFRSGESGDHVRRLQRITRELLTGTELGEGLSEQTVEDIALAALMHDVGKIAIPDAILNKPGRLTAEEFEIMKTHTVQGAKLLENIPQMRDHSAYEYAIDIAMHHHERWDGRGYPHGLKGDEISVGVQIVSLADVYDALVSPRVYKAAFSHEKALEMILNGECGVFSPRLLECFRQMHPRIRALYETKEELQ